MKPIHWIIIVAVLAFIYWRYMSMSMSEDDDDGGSGSGGDGNGSGGLKPSDELEDYEVAVDDKHSASSATPKLRVEYLGSSHSAIPIGKTPSNGRWFGNRRDALHYCRNHRLAFVEGSGNYAGQFGCFSN